MSIRPPQPERRQSEPSSPAVHGARQTLSRWLAQNGLRRAPQREVVLDALFAQPGEISIEELVGRLRARGDRVGTATVYRSMKVLLAAGLALDRRSAAGAVRYRAALGKSNLNHLICDSCRASLEFSVEPVKELLVRRHGFLVGQQGIALHGLCRECQAQQRHAR